ncbi:DUF459 domain-containing protein [Methylopila turkensis]|uniref:SGNH hydrolase-type esterase domain-containing protein n=1 Tax=Methylopila turkensis TaxID=1437816 RepID=A0A9W6JPQ7_9HYPH|nr:DUF459 domain-containing protein [Methylopila turkensis]GLK79358.1 hypothetical protein GCM10008174_10990 [Methylopila turkensis]
MTRLVRWLLLALIAPFASLAASSGASAQDGVYQRRYYDPPRVERRYYDEDERYVQQRLRAIRRDSAVLRREAERRAAYEAAQREQSRRGGFGVPFLQRLFGGSRPEADERWSARTDPGAVEVRPKPKRIRRRPPEATPAAALLPAVTPPEVAAAPPAAPPSTFVVVIGDSIADGLAGGLTEAFVDAPDVAVKRVTKPNAGLVRGDYYDFVAAARQTLDEGPATYAVFDVGVNDRQPFLDMRDAAPLSPRWKERYAQRIDALLAPFKERKIPIYWVGLAPSESVRASSDHTALNALARERVEAAGGTYVDVWEGFVDEAGDYAAVGPQLDGQTAKLRLDDGVHFSKAGARKLAHYVEQEIRKVYTPKPAVPADAVAGTTTDAPEPNAPPLAAKPKPLAGPLMVLTAPRTTQGGALLGSGSPAAAETLLVRGEAPSPTPGRLDDHRWPAAAGPDGDASAKPDAAPRP